MSKRLAQSQGGGERYGEPDSFSDMSDRPQRATAAQMARRTIAQTRKPSGSQRSSRAGTPTAFGQQGVQQSMPSFQPPTQSGTGFGGDFSFSVNTASNPFAQTNGASASPPPAGFQFGGVSNQTQQNGGKGGMFGNNNTSFGSIFDASSQQPLQNGFIPSTTIFGQNQNDSNKGNTSSVFAGFGQSNQSQSQQNGLTPSSNNSFPSFGKQNSENPFKGFGQSQQQTQSTANTSFNSFGQNAQQNGDKAPSTSFSFGQSTAQSQVNAAKPLFGSTPEAEQTPKMTTSNVFANFGQQNQQNGNKPLFTSTSQPDQTPKTSTSNIFGGHQSSAQPLFGATPPPESGTQTPKPGESVFGSMNQSKKDGIHENMFTQSRDQTPKPSTNTIFGAIGQQPEQNDSNAAEQTPKPSNIFGGSNQSQPNGVKPGLFSGASAQSEQQTPKPSAGLFSGAFGQQQTSLDTTTPVFKFGQSQQDTSMTTPGNTPQKLAGSAQATSQQPPEVSYSDASNQTAGQGGSFFDRVTPSDDPLATAQKPLFQPSTSLFSAPAANDESQKTPTGQGGSLFDGITPRDPPATAIEAPFTPSTSLLNKPSEKTAAPWISHAPVAASEQPVPSAPSQATTTAVGEIISDAEKKTLKVLNEGLISHLAKQDPNADWTSIMQYYMQQVAKIRKKPEPKFDAPAAAAQTLPESGAASSIAQQTPASANLFASLHSRPQPSASSTNQSTSALFSPATPKPSASSFQQTPKPSGPTSLLNPPQTAPVNKKRPAEDDVERLPATEKRARSIESTEYPKLPENASETAKLFQAAFDKSSNTTPAVLKSSAEAKEKERVDKEAREKAEKEKKEAEEKEKQTQNQTSGGFKPSTAGFTPSAPSGMPTFSGPTSAAGGFLAAFGKKANAEEEKERKKRKMEDYDSDEETEEAWAERDKVEQQAKRQKILDAAKSGAGFTPSGSAGTTPAPESDIGEGSEKGSEKGNDTDTETPVGQGKSLFERMTPRDPPATAPSKIGLYSARPSDVSKAAANLFAPKTPSALGMGSTTPNIFSQFSQPRQSIETSEEDKTEAEKDQGTGDHTWKPSTPIKFGGNTSTTAESTTPAAPLPLGNLFGTSMQKSSTDSTGHLNVPKPTFGFNFGGQLSSGVTSRATTPGFTTDGEGASTAGEGDDEDEQPAQNEPQVEDQTGLRESEKESEDLLFSVHMAKAMKWGEKKNDNGDMIWGWVDKGKGPLYILKHKETGKVRVVLKVPPYGTPRMNFEPLKNVEYEVQGGSGKLVQGIFVDHMDEKNSRKLSKWLVQVGKPDDAKEMAKVLMENRAT